MGWWATGEGDDVMGDMPADIIYFAMKDITQRYEELRQPKPTLEEALDAMVSVLRMKLGEIVSDEGEIYIQRLVAKLEPNPVIVSSREDVTIEPYLVTVFDRAFNHISAVYEEVINRKPSLRELLHCLTFSLSCHLDEYFSIDEDIYITKILSETGQKEVSLNYIID